MALRSKTSARFALITPDLVWLLAALLAVQTHPDVPSEGLVITSGSDGTHLPTSKHYTGQALDVRSHTFASRAAKRRFQAAWLAALGPGYTVLLEQEGTPNEHFHAQRRKGLDPGTVSWPTRTASADGPV